MTKKQIETLKTLGYKKSDEDGAILRHPHMTWQYCFVWKDDKFDEVLRMHSSRVALSVRNQLSYEVNNLSMKHWNK